MNNNQFFFIPGKWYLHCPNVDPKKARTVVEHFPTMGAAIFYAKKKGLKKYQAFVCKKFSEDGMPYLTYDAGFGVLVWEF